MISVNSLSPICYYDPTLFSDEIQRVFRDNWIFVGFTRQIPNHNDFITKSIVDYPVIIQNVEGRIKAFANVCSHRKARIHLENSGNRPLTCHYHCWQYDECGKLKSVPKNQSDFQLNENDKQKLGLSTHSVALCGEMIFVHINLPAQDLTTFLGPFFERLSNLSSYFSQPVDKGIYTWQANWKLAVETVLEVYHVPGTHPESFAKIAKTDCEIEHYNGHTRGYTSLKPSPQKWWQGVRKIMRMERHPNHDQYDHYFIYPNLAIGITDGSLASIQTYEPIDAYSSALHFRLFLSKSQESEKPLSQVVKSAIIKNFSDFNHQTLEEDRVMAEACHANMKVNDIPGLLGKSEQRISYFHAAWRNQVKPEGQ
jgi:choline monooxygenase